MTALNKQALRQSAEKAQEHGVFNMDIHSETVLALLDELEAAEKRIAEPVSVPDERAAFETFMEKRFKDCIDRRMVKNGGGEYFAWDMQVAWIVWQGRAAMLQGAEPATDNTNQQFESLSRGGK